METARTHPERLRNLARELAAVEEKLGCEIAICTANATELRRQYQALTKRRGGPGSADARKYALGSTLVMVGIDGINDTALLGLFAHPHRMAFWTKQALAAEAGPMLGDIIRWLFADPVRHEWCLQWGRILQWRGRKALYVEEVMGFFDSDRLGPQEPWRRKPMTIGQADLVLTLTTLLEEPAPDLKNRGEAFEWIRECAGNPHYWREPSLPPNLEEDDER